MGGASRVKLSEDVRSGRVIFVSHCILNQNSKVYGIAYRPAAITEVVNYILKNNIGIVQMPCPESTYWGLRRWAMLKEQYDVPRFREYCRELAREVANQVVEYLRSGYVVAAIIGCDGSPVCGVNWTNTYVSGQWGGFITEETFRNPPKQKLVKGMGVFMEELSRELRSRGVEVPIIGYPEMKELGGIDEFMKVLERVVKEALRREPRASPTNYQRSG